MSGAVPEAALANVLDSVAAWNEPDAATRLKLLERCWAADGIYVDPNVELRGRSALCQHIATVQAGRPGARIELMSGVELHHHARPTRGEELHAGAVPGSDPQEG